MTTSETKGWRAVPPALLLAMAAWIVFTAFRLILFLGSNEERFWSARISLVSEGVSTASYVLALLGTLDLARRTAGREGFGVRIAAAGLAFALLVDVGSGLLNFKSEIWRHEWFREVVQYCWFAGWLIIPAGFAVALWTQNRALAIAGMVVALLTTPAPFYAQDMYKWLGLGFKGYLTLDSTLRIARTGVILAMILSFARGTSSSDRSAAASGLRTAARAMWLRVIAAIAVVLMTLIAVSGGGQGGGRSQGSLETLKLAMMAAAIVNLISFVMFGLGIARTARAALAELPRWPLVLAGGASLWCAGVGFAQLPYVYRQLYKGGDHDYGMGDYTTVLIVAVPLVVIAAAALVAYAIGKFGAHRSSIDLSQQAQAKGVGFVMMMLASLGITQWMVPKADSVGSLAMLMLLAAAAGLIATVMIARLCAQAAEELERDPGLPTATVVSEST